MRDPDAIVVGSGPNGLAAAIVLARARRRVVVYEAASTVGGGCRSAALTLPGFVHDVCSAVHPMAAASPFLRSLPLADHGLAWISPPAMLAHPFDDRPAAVVGRSIESTALGLGIDDGAYRKVVGSAARTWSQLEEAILSPPRWPAHPMTLARFGLHALQPAQRLAEHAFHSARARGLIAGLAAHAMLPLNRPPTGGVAIVLAALAHTAGWVFPRGGAQRLADALAGYLRSLGGAIVTDAPVTSLRDLPPARAVLCDLSPRPFLEIAGSLLPDRYRRRLERYRYGIGAFKVDWAIEGAIPWSDPACARAGTVHLGGTLDEIAASERAPWAGAASDRPFVLLSQPAAFDDSRAPAGRQTVWAYCHVPHGSTVDMLPAIEAQVERFAPGFRERVLARHVMTPADLERHNPNLVGGDIAGGVANLRQLVARPTLRWYSTPARGVYLCSSSTPPGVGVHGMCGYYAASLALQESLRE